jgi:hypothetical protein
VQEALTMFASPGAFSSMTWDAPALHGIPIAKGGCSLRSDSAGKEYMNTKSVAKEQA